MPENFDGDATTDQLDLSWKAKSIQVDLLDPTRRSTGEHCEKSTRRYGIDQLRSSFAVKAAGDRCAGEQCGFVRRCYWREEINPMRYIHATDG